MDEADRGPPHAEAFAEAREGRRVEGVVEGSEDGAGGEGGAGDEQRKAGEDGPRPEADRPDRASYTGTAPPAPDCLTEPPRGAAMRR